MSAGYVPFDTKGLPAVSVSKIETFVKCPLSYKLAYVDKVRGESTPEQAFGVAIHGCMESIVRWVIAEEFQGRVPEEMVLKFFRDAFFANVDSGELGLYNDGLAMVRRYFRSSPPVDYRDIVAAERRFVLSLGAFAVVGVMDRVDRDGDDGISIADYKTSKNLYSNDELEDSLQASVYLLAARKLWPWAKKLSFRFEMLRHDVSQKVERVAADLPAIEQYLLGIYDKMTNAKKFPAKPNFFCPWCGQKSACKFYQDLMKVPLTDREPVVADPHADLDLLAAEREKLSAAESIAKKEKGRFDTIIKRFIRETSNGKMKANGKLYTIFSKEVLDYDTKEVSKILLRHIRAEISSSDFMSVDDAKLRKYVEEKIPMRSQRAMIMAELEACAKKTRVGGEYVNSTSIDGGRRA
jgi:putative RecB family exonuclease